MKKTSQEIEIGGKTLILETGFLAGQANAAVTARLGDTMVLVTVVSSSPREDLDYFPLGVEYMERLYAGGRIKGSRWVKRDGRPTDEATLTARLIDRSIRPLFPEGYKSEIQVVATVLSVDAENDADIPAICATAAALAISDIPWQGPVGAIRLGLADQDGKEKFLVNPTFQELEKSKLSLVISATDEAVVMLEGSAQEVTEKVILKGFGFAQKEIKKIIRGIGEFQKKVGRAKQTFKFEKIDEKLVSGIKKELGDKLEKLIINLATKEETGVSYQEIIEALVDKYDGEKKANIIKVVDQLMKKAIRSKILTKSQRPDGRKLEEIRPLTIETGVLPRTHGSAMFKRGNTQTLTITTLGSPAMEQLIENMEGEETKRYIHHYNMPPFSLGEVGRLGWPSRREIGHGALAERALLGMIPAEDDFPYTIMVVSEIMSSNGSTSMASVCGSTLSLMDAGVPIKAPVAGIAMGLMTDGKGKTVILSDILGLEDFNGDMDFKVAGTKQGVTAIQMDVKAAVLDIDLLKKALQQAKKGRLFILEKMLQVLAEPKKEVSRFAPKVEILRIPEEKIGEVIGPGGRIIKKIIAETGATVDVEDDGKVSVTSADKEGTSKAIEWIKGLVREVQAGESFEGVVTRIQPFGAFVEILPGKEGLVHVSKMTAGFVNDPAEVVKIGQKVKVRVTEIDDMGRINLSMISDQEAAQKKDQQRPQTRRDFSQPSRFEPRFPSSGFDRRRRPGGRRSGGQFAGLRGQNSRRS